MNNRTIFHKILQFTKIEHTAFSLPMIFSGAYLGAGSHLPQLSVLMLIFLAAVGARIFGMAFNRIFDRRIDALNHCHGIDGGFWRIGSLSDRLRPFR